MSDPFNQIFYPAVAGIVAALFVAILSKVWKYYHELKYWREKEIDKLEEVIENEKELELIISPRLIPIMGQKEAPNDGINAAVSDYRFNIIEMLLKAFSSNKTAIGKKRYVILGGSGMGKTTFSAKLFYKHINKYRFKKNPIPIYIFYLGNSDVLERIKMIKSKDSINNSIIILDALDDSLEAAKDVNKYMQKLEELTSKFKYVIITCRTQFFKDELSEPNRITCMLNGVKTKSYNYEKIYISPFTEDESCLYFEYKYQMISDNYRKALDVFAKCKDLISRPMILSFIDDLLPIANNDNLTTVKIYSTIINAWFNREIESQRGENIQIEELWSFSKKLSYTIYKNYQNNGNMFLTSDEYHEFLVDNKYVDSPFSFKVRSLINRKNDGSIKFSHKSFLEFFLAIHSLENPGLSYRSDGFDMAVTFSKDIYREYLKGEPIDFIQLKPTVATGRIVNEYLIDQLTDIYNRVNDKQNDGCFYLYLESLLQYLPKLDTFRTTLLLTIMIWLKERRNTVENSNSLNFINELIKQNEILSSIIEAQNYFVGNKNICFSDYHKKMISNLQFEDSMMSEIKKDRKLFNYLSQVSNSEIMVYPYLYNFDKEEIKRVLHNTILNIGYGFIKNREQMLDFINRVICGEDLNSRVGILSLISQSDDMSIHSSFIRALAERVNNAPMYAIGLSQLDKDKFQSNYLIVKVICQSTTIHYLVTEDTNSLNQKEIETCLTNMITAKKCYLCGVE